MTRECDEWFKRDLSKYLCGNECVLYLKPLTKNSLKKQNRSCKSIEDVLNGRETDEDILDNANDNDEEHDEEEDNEDDEEDHQQTVNCLADDFVGYVIALQA